MPDEDESPKTPLCITVDVPEDLDKSLAVYRVHPGVHAILATDPWISVQDGDGNGPSLDAQMAKFRQLIAKANEGDQSRSKAMLVAQMNTLDTLFNGLVRKAGFNLNDGYLPAAEMMLKLAFKAQAQARASAEALNEIINPRTTSFVKQANIAHNQQVNNGAPTGGGGAVVDGSRAEENDNPPNELLEQKHGERLEFGATSAAISDGETVATVGEIDRAENTARKSNGES